MTLAAESIGCENPCVNQMGGHRANGPAPAPKGLASMHQHPIPAFEERASG